MRDNMKEFVEKLIGRLEEEKESAKKRNAFDSEVSYRCAIEIVNQLAEEYKGKDCSQCSRRSWYQKGYKDAEKKFAEEMGVSKIENTTTNADRIRSMSDEELAEFLIRQHACDNCEYFGGGARCKAPNKFKCTNEYATAVVQKWLQSEVKGSE